MSANIILTNLTQKQLLTQEELTTLTNSPAFFSDLVKIFEEKTALYLTACQWGVGKTLQVPSNQLSAKTLEKTVECALSVFMDSDRYSVLGSLRLILEVSDPDLPLSVGLKALSNSGDNLEEVVKKVFVSYVARYRLFRSVDPTALGTLCSEAERQNPHLFPTYLFNALQIESELARTLQGDRTQISQQLPLQMQANVRPVFECTRAVVYYLGTLAGATVSNQLRDRYFDYTSNPQKLSNFSADIAQGYLIEMIQPQKVLSMLQASAQILSSEANKVCLPTLRLLGISVELDLQSLSGRVQEIQRAIEENNRNKDKIRNEFERAKNESFRQIDQWRSNLPERPVTFGIQVGMPFNLK